MSDLQGQSLGQTFRQAKDNQQELDSLDPRSDGFKEMLSSVVRDLERCQKLVVELSIFSPNEELEDISTQNIQYLTIDYHLAELKMKAYDQNRLDSLKRCFLLLESFLERLDLYRMLSTTDRKLFERFRENRSKFTLVGTSNAEERRNAKIKRFQEEKELKKKLEVRKRSLGSEYIG
jgi:immunoglobulin-binding protein 1